MLRRPVLLAAVLLVALSVGGVGAANESAGAAETTSCDIGPVRNARITIDGTTYIRPDSRIDGQPSTTSIGPFPVTADVNATVGRIDVVYWTDSNQAPGITAMPIVGSVAAGMIPPLSVTAPGDTAFFYLQAFDSRDNLFWIDQILPECDARGGDPYHINIVVPDEPGTTILRLTGTPICIEHPLVQTEPAAAALHVGEQFVATDGDRYLIVTGEPSCSFNCNGGADANCDNVLGDYCAVELNLHRVRDVGMCLAAIAPAAPSPTTLPHSIAAPAVAPIRELAHTGADTGLAAIAVGLIACGAAAAGWARRRRQIAD